MKKFIAAIALASIACLAYGQDGFVSIVDGTVTINGSFSKVAGLDIKSEGGYLSRGPGTTADGLEIPGQGHAPFAFGEPSFLANTPNQITYGVLGADKTIDIEGATKTAALYSESLEVANGDLCVFLGVDRATDLPVLDGCRIVPEPSSSLMAMMAAVGGLLTTRKRRFIKSIRHGQHSLEKP